MVEENYFFKFMVYLGACFGFGIIFGQFPKKPFID
jgi:hypothetical protein